MDRATVGGTRGRWARPLVWCALVPSLVMAQEGDHCERPALTRYHSEHFAYPLGATSVGESLLVLGEPAYRFLPTPPGELVRNDSMFAGVLIGPDGRLRPIARPPGARAFLYPRVLARKGGSVDAVWSEPVLDPRTGERTMEHRLFAAPLDGSKWGRVDSLGTVRLVVGLSRQLGSDLVQASGRRYLVFPSTTLGLPAGTIRRNDLLVLSDSGGRWRVHAFDLGMGSITSVSAAAVAGELTVAFVGIPSTLPPGRIGRIGPHVWITRFRAGRFLAPERVSVEAPENYGNVTLLSSGAHAIVAWVSDGERGGLEWSDATPGAVRAPAHRLPGISLIASGQAPWNHLLIGARTDGNSVVLRLRRDGFEPLATVPTGAGLLPVLAGRAGAPVALSTELVDRPDPGPIRLVAYDLRCALRR